MSETIALETVTNLPRSKRLKAVTSGTHDTLDKAIMAGEPFRDRERYALFLKVQHQFHRDINALYDNAKLDAVLPDLQGRRRFSLIGDDLSDLAVSAPEITDAPVFASSDDIDLPTALGWLYVAEGSNMGAAFLLKAAQKIGLSEAFGARHLAGAPEGRGLHWRTFTQALDDINLSEDEEDKLVAGAESAFKRVHALVKQMFG
ncbi:heme oxygenase [Paenochrobactrum gallinarii]|uniref:Heme oxygenase n=1 Tax=Paenochrobactrum gallinarii TaxID=643673 RepID=A0A841M6U4_9HYPH|nr:biliverdin-producing heme oxygenase [Paenochrobactrum gallinarii]MBB6261858.1 heme oxygenase [Paenochrobactrum gallinarii]